MPDSRGGAPGEDPSQDAGPMVMVASLSDPILDDGDSHHLSAVLRLRSGDSVILCDGAGSWRSAEYRADADPSPVGSVVTTRTPSPPVGVGFALIKGGRPELVCQKLCELGVDRIVVFPAARSVVSWDEKKVAKNMARLRAVAREAALQSRRTVLPEVSWAPDTRCALEALGPRVAVADRSGDLIDAGRHDGGAAAHDGGAGRCDALLVGPEGGWEPGELDDSTRRVRIARHVLRAETAAIASGVLLTARRGN